VSTSRVERHGETRDYSVSLLVCTGEATGREACSSSALHAQGIACDSVKPHIFLDLSPTICNSSAYQSYNLNQTYVYSRKQADLFLGIFQCLTLTWTMSKDTGVRIENV